MAEGKRRDRDNFARAHEEAAIESWVEDSGHFLMIPGGDTTRQRVEIGRRPQIRRCFPVSDFLALRPQAGQT